MRLDRERVKQEALNEYCTFFCPGADFGYSDTFLRTRCRVDVRVPADDHQHGLATGMAGGKHNTKYPRGVDWHCDASATVARGNHT